MADDAKGQGTPRPRQEATPRVPAEVGGESKKASEPSESGADTSAGVAPAGAPQQVSDYGLEIPGVTAQRDQEQAPESEERKLGTDRVYVENGDPVRYRRSFDAEEDKLVRRALDAYAGLVGNGTYAGRKARHILERMIQIDVV